MACRNCQPAAAAHHRPHHHRLRGVATDVLSAADSCALLPCCVADPHPCTRRVVAATLESFSALLAFSQVGAHPCFLSGIWYGALHDRRAAALAGPSFLRSPSGMLQPPSQHSPIPWCRPPCASQLMAAPAPPPPAPAPETLPQPLAVLRCRAEGPYGPGPETTYYVLGTAHVSADSCGDVATLIRAVKPQARRWRAPGWAASLRAAAPNQGAGCPGLHPRHSAPRSKPCQTGSILPLPALEAQHAGLPHRERTQPCMAGPPPTPRPPTPQPPRRRWCSLSSAASASRCSHWTS